MEIDREVCIGAGNCVLTAPDLFDQDDDGIVVPLVDDPAAVDPDGVRDAVDRCPSGALRLRSEG
nr:(4Fe-4S)-binding protein [Pseudonocardia acidicola]